MTITAPSSSANSVRRDLESQYRRSPHFGSSQPANASNSDNIEMITPAAHRQNTAAESARARENLKAFGDNYVRTHRTVNHLSDPLNMEQNIKSTAHHIPEFSLPIQFQPNRHGADGHAYFQSTDTEFNHILNVVNNRIHRSPELQQKLHEVTPESFTANLFSKPSKGVEKAYRHMLDHYGEGIYPILSALIDPSTGTINKRPGHLSPVFKLDAMMGQEMDFNANTPALSQVLHDELGFAANQLKKSHPEERKLIQDWRVKQSARYVMKRATNINSTWGEWAASAGLTTLWSFGTDILGKNAGIASLFRKELKKTEYPELPTWRKLILGVPDKIYNGIIKNAGSAKRTGAVATGVMGQGSAEVPDVLILQGAIKRSGAEGETLTAWQGFKHAVATKKLDTAKAVVSASIGTSFEKAKEMIWIPASLGGKIGQTAAGFITNGVSVLSCGLPFFTEGGPQHREAAQILAHTYNPVSGHLKLPEADKIALKARGTAKAVEQYFMHKAGQQILHSSPTSKVVAASVPVALGVSLLPSAINGAATFLPEGLVPEVVKTTVSWLQVPAFGPIELLAMNVVAKANKSHPQLVEKLSKVGRPVINGVYAPFSVGKRVAKDGWNFVRGRKPENPHVAYQDFLRDLNRSA